MNFANYAEFRTRVQQLIDGDDVSVSDLSSTILDLLIDMGEQRIYREVRSSTMDTSLSVAVSSNSATLPSDLIELRSIYFTGERPLEIVTYEQMLTYQGDSPDTGIVRFAAQIADTLTFWPSASGTLLGRYYKKFSDISSGITSNTLFARHPDLFIYAALSESAPFIGENERLPLWEEKYQERRAAANRDELVRVYGSSSLTTRVA